MDNDQPSNSEAAGDEAGTTTLADRCREVFTAAGLGNLSPEDAARVEAIEMAADHGVDLEDIRDAIELDVTAVQQFIDEDLGHLCRQCEDVVTGWCPTFDVTVCTGCLELAEDAYQEAQDRAGGAS